MAIDRSKMRKNLSGRADESAKNAASSGSWHPVWHDLPIPVYKKIPEKIPFVFDIIPFVVSEDFLVNEQTHRVLHRKDEYYYSIDYWVHTKCGPSNHNILCPRKSLGLPCPICEIADERKKEVEFGDKEKFKVHVKPFLPMHRHMYQIWVHDRAKEEENKGVQLLDMAHFSLEQNLLLIAKDPETGENIEFSWPGVEGKRICFMREGAGATNTQYLGHKFIDRKEEIPDEIVNQAVPLNEYITIYTYDEISDIINGSQGASEDDEEQSDNDSSEKKEAPVRKRRQLPGKEVKKNPCPFNHKFGEDCDQEDDCSACDDDVYTKCAAARDDQ